MGVAAQTTILKTLIYNLYMVLEPYTESTDERVPGNTAILAPVKSVGLTPWAKVLGMTLWFMCIYLPFSS